MSHKQNLEARVRDCENKLQRLNNEEYKVRCPNEIKILLAYTIAYCDAELFTLSLQ